MAAASDDDGSVDAPATEERPREIARRVVAPVLRRWVHLTVEGGEHLPATGGVLVASTHASHLDAMALGASLSRPVSFLGDERLTRWPVLGSWLPRIGMVPVDRGHADRAALGILETVLEAGEVVVVFPEGSRTRDGRVYRPRSGTARLAAAARVPVVPAAVVGSHEVWPAHRGPRWRGGDVTIRLAPPLDPPDATPLSRRAFNEALHARLADLSGQVAADAFAPLDADEAAT